MNNLVSIIIPTKDGLPYLKQCLESLERHQDYPFEVIIVDNGSSDGTSGYIETLSLNINGNYIRNEKNEGFAKANNQAAKIARGEYLCLLNNDTIVTKEWLKNMVAVFEEEEKVGVVGSRLVHMGRGTIQHAGVHELSTGMPDHLHFGIPMNHPIVMERKKYMAVTGACLLTTKEIYNNIGGLDERYVNGFEDIDYCHRVTNMGYNVYYEPTSLVYHYESKTPERYLRDTDNMNLYMREWYGKKKGV